MDEKKVREAIELIDGIIEVVVILPEGGGDINKALDLAIEALEKQLPKKPIVVSNTCYNRYQCPRCNDYICKREPICLKCEQPIDWTK